MLRKGEYNTWSPRQKAAFFSAGSESIPTAEELGKYKPDLYLEGSWEYILFRDCFTRFAHFWSTVTFHSNQDLTNKGLLMTAKQLTDRMFWTEMRHTGKLQVADWRAGGISLTLSLYIYRVIRTIRVIRVIRFIILRLLTTREI